MQLSPPPATPAQPPLLCLLRPPRRYEEDQAALRALRMALRALTTRLLSAHKWKDFWEPPEEGHDYWQRVEQVLRTGGGGGVRKGGEEGGRRGGGARADA